MALALNDSNENQESESRVAVLLYVALWQFDMDSLDTQLWSKVLAWPSKMG